MKFLQIVCSYLALISVLGLSARCVNAQAVPDEPLGIAQYIQMPNVEGELPDGSIIALQDGGFKLSDVAYSPHAYGVIALKPAVALSHVGKKDAYPAVTTGSVNVRVNTQNGPIASGDFLTTSDEPGVAMKATQAGFIIGTAQASYDGQDEGFIPVALEIRFVTSSDQFSLSPQGFIDQFQDVVTVGIRAVASEPNTALRYIVAAVILIACAAFGFFTFGRAAANGVISIGRNPLARKSIFAMVGFNIFITVMMIAAGVILGFFILAV